MTLAPLLFLTPLATLVVLCGWTLIRNRKDVYVSSVMIHCPFEVVWVWISDPCRYGQLYPNWIRNVIPKGSQVFRVEDRFGGSYDMILSQHKECGIIDLQMGLESSRSRVYPIDEHRTAVVHLAKRWNEVNLLMWFFHQWTINRDFHHAKRIIEEAS